MSILSLQEFLQIPSDEIDISVDKVHSSIVITTYEVILSIQSRDYTYAINKRYTEFQGFYDSLTIRYQNINIPAFPSKFDIFKKEEKRRKFFDSLLKTVVQLSQAHPEIKKELLKLLYEFIFSSHTGTVVETKSKISTSNLSDTASNNSYDTQSVYSSKTVK